LTSFFVAEAQIQSHFKVIAVFCRPLASNLIGGIYGGISSSIDIYNPIMAKQSTTGKLPAVSVNQAKPKTKPYKLSGGCGLYLLINPNGCRYWRLKYRVDQKEKVLALTVYPDISIAQAREQAQKAKQLLKQYFDPDISRKQEKAEVTHNTFKPIAEEWHKKESGRWSKSHAERVWQTLEADSLSHLGNMPIGEVALDSDKRCIQGLEKQPADSKRDVVLLKKQRPFSFATILH
jgi:hypothetical protein